MKKVKVSLIYTIILAILINSAALATQNFIQEGDISLVVAIEDSQFMLGEMVPITISIHNNATSPVAIYSEDVWSGDIKVYIAKKGEDFFRYYGPTWGQHCSLIGTKEGKTTQRYLQPQEALSQTVTILWNEAPPTGPVNAYTARIANRRDAVKTAYAFPEEGTYLVKVVASNFISNGKPLESEPIEIKLVEPQGEGLAVWAEMKKNPFTGYLIQGMNSPQSAPVIVVSTGSQILKPALDSAVNSMSQIEAAMGNSSNRLAKQVRDSAREYRERKDKQRQ